MPVYEEKCLSQQEIYKGRVVSLTRDTIQLPGGGTSAREVVHHGGGAGILALNDKGEVALVRQYRYALGRVMREIPAGKIEPGEPPLQTARRELEEETGFAAEELIPFGQSIPTCGYCNEVIYLFWAKGLRATTQNLDSDEYVEVEWLPLDEAVSLVLSGEIDDSKSQAALLKAKLLQSAGQLPL